MQSPVSRTPPGQDHDAGRGAVRQPPLSTISPELHAVIHTASTLTLRPSGARDPHRDASGHPEARGCISLVVGERHAAAPQLPNLSLHVSQLRLEWMDDCWHDVDAAGEWLLGLERTIAPDIVHLNGYVHAALPWSTPTLVVAHSCVLSWWRGTHGVDAPSRYDTYRARVAHGLAPADLVVAPTAAMLRML